MQRLLGRVGLTRRRGECFIRLWAYLQSREQQGPVSELAPVTSWVPCTCREAATLFYAGSERGSERSAGMMLDKLAALGLIQKRFDGNSLAIAIPTPPSLAEPVPVNIFPDRFDPRCDAVPVAHLLAQRYQWMNQDSAVPYRIAQRLRRWADQYDRGMRVLRRQDNLNPVGFCLLYPTARQSEILFFGSPSKGLHLSTMDEEDPFELASPGADCRAVFIRSWAVDPAYAAHTGQFLQDAQATLRLMTQDFPHLCDLHTLIIHRHYEPLAHKLGFQRLGSAPQSAIYWMYLALDRFLETDIAALDFQP